MGGPARWERRERQLMVMMVLVGVGVGGCGTGNVEGSLGERWGCQQG